jgi:hypothetical protein
MVARDRASLVMLLPIVGVRQGWGQLDACDQPRLYLPHTFPSLCRATHPSSAPARRIPGLLSYSSKLLRRYVWGDDERTILLAKVGLP